MAARVLVPLAVLCHLLALFSLNVPIDRHTLAEIHSHLHDTSHHHHSSDLSTDVKTHVRVQAHRVVATNSLLVHFWSVRVRAEDFHSLEEVFSVMVVVASVAAFRDY